MKKHRIASAAIALFLAALVVAGCGHRKTLGKVSGNVATDGKPVANAVLGFHNQEAGIHILANVVDGKYEVKTADGLGLPPGEYAVSVHPPRVENPVGPMLPMEREFPSVPPRYRSEKTSGLTATVTAGVNRFDIEMRP